MALKLSLPWRLTPLELKGSGLIRFKSKVVDCKAISNSTNAAYDKMVLEVKQSLEINHPELPLGKYGRDDHELLLWFLKDRRFDVHAASQKLANFIKWREEFGVRRITEKSIRKLAASGKAYLHISPDIKGRPVLVVVAAKHSPAENEALDSMKLCVYLVERAVESLQPGGEQQILGIFDLRGFTAYNADLKFAKFLIDVFYHYYPKRLGQVLFVDAPFIFQPGWSLIKPLLKSYGSLVRFCSVETVRREYFQADTVPQDFK